MRWLTTILLRFRSLFHRRAADGELDSELRFHLDKQIAANIAAGMPPAEARRQAMLEFGGVEELKEECRDMRKINWLQDLAQDLRFGLRMLRKSPGFTAVAVLTLALGIGATSALFSMVEAVLLKPLPYKEANRLAILWTDNAKQNLHQERTSYPNFEDWQQQNTTFEDMAFASALTVNVTSSEEPERLLAGRTSANLFSFMGVKPILGRAFSSEEEKRGDRVIVVSEGLWLRSFGSSQDVVGKGLEVDGVKMTIVGVMPATFQFPDRGVDLWEPLTLFSNWNALKFKRDTPLGCVIGRLKRGVSFSQAQADMNVIGSRLAQQYPELVTNLDFFGFAINVMPFDVYVTGRQVRVALWLLFGAVLLVLFIACTNVASLLLSRGVARTREFATRLALGAGRGRVIRQLLMETMVMYLISAASGVAFAAVAVRLLIRLAPADIPELHESGIDSGVLFFALVVSFFAAFIFGLFPALRVSGTDPHLALKGSGRGISQSPSVLRLRSLLVTAEFAVALILLVGAGLLIRSFFYAQHVDLGFRSDHVLTARVVQSKLKSETQWRDFYGQSLARIGAIPGVEAAGAIDNFFFASFPDDTVIVEGHAQLSPGTLLSQVADDGVSPGYFHVLGVPLLRGRFFTDEDATASPRTAIINATMSRRFWPDEDPLGKRFKFGYQPAADPWVTVVGVVGDMHRDGVTRDSVSQIFFPLAQHPARGMDLLIRTSADPRSVASAVRGAVRSADKNAPVFDVSTLEDTLREQVAPRRFQTLLLSLFASLAVILSAIGIYGLMHYSVTQRTHEIGMRVALGAQRRDILRLILRDGMFLASVGIVIGVSGALALTRFLRSMLFEVKPTDPATFIGVAILLALVALAACYIPARRATRVDPMVALRYE